jgi:hypothetical protein
MLHVVCVVFAVLSEHVSGKHTVFVSLVGVEGYVWDSEVNSMECTKVDQKLLNSAFFLVLTGYNWYSMPSPCNMIHLSQGIMPWLEHLLTSSVWNSASVPCDYS